MRLLSIISSRQGLFLFRLLEGLTRLALGILLSLPLRWRLDDENLDLRRWEREDGAMMAAMKRETRERRVVGALLCMHLLLVGRMVRWITWIRGERAKEEEEGKPTRGWAT